MEIMQENLKKLHIKKFKYIFYVKKLKYLHN